MCGRFTLHHSTEEVAARFAVQQVLFPLTPRYNIAPSQPIAVVTQNGERRLEGYKWGLVPFWSKDPAIGNRLINARAETLAEKPAFKHALMRRRCLIPADGFYEWPKEEKVGDKEEARLPLHIRLRNGELYAFAGLWEEWKAPNAAPDDPPLRTCTIITTDPNPLLASIHHRMAVILRPEDEDVWLDTSVKDASELISLLRPYPDKTMEMYPVSRRVNTPAFDAPECIQPFVEDEGQLQLLND